jgi:hypothetical protein
MTKPTPRSDVVKAVSEAAAILDEALPLEYVGAGQPDRPALRAAAMPVILRELLDVEVSES